MVKHPLCLLATLLWLCGSAAAQPSQSESTQLKGLLITGGCCHDYDRQTLILTEGLSQRANIRWDVFRGPDTREEMLAVYSKPDWSAGYDVVLHNECYGAIDDQAYVERIVRGHAETGVAAVVVHCSMHSYRAAPTDQWRMLLGVTSRRHETGGRRLEVTRLAADHPIMQGFPEKWTTPNGELYVIEKVWPDCTPLASAYGIDTKKEHVCMWTNTYGKARVFGTTLGHHNETMMAEPWLDAVGRGLLWSCGRLDEAGQPLPGYAGSGKAAFSFQVAAAANAGEPTEADWAGSIKFPAAETPQRLFNGRDFTGWEGHIDKYFSIKDGVIIARNTEENAPPVSTYLLTTKKYRNFRLVFEGKLVESMMHSGIAIWGRKYDKDGEPFSYQGHLVMFPAGWGFYDLYRRNSIYQDDGRAQKTDRQGDWNHMEILAIGNRIRLAVNGQEVADWQDPQPELCEAGPIGLQLHSNKVPQEVRFRGLILAENPEDRLITVDSK